MAARKLDLVVERINEQNELDQNQLDKQAQTYSRIVDILNKNREDPHIITELNQRRFQDGRVRSELVRLEKIKTPKMERCNTIDTKMNTFRRQNYMLNPKNKDNIFNYIDNLDYVLDKHNEFRYNYHKTMKDHINFYKYRKDRYYANIYDRFYNINNDKKWMQNDIVFFLNQAINDEFQEEKDYYEANKLERYATLLKNKHDDKVQYFKNFRNKHIDVKTKYNDYYLEKDDLLIKQVNDLREGKIDNYNEQDRDYYHKIIIDKEELNRRHKIEDKKRKKRVSKIKKMEEERRQKMQKIMEKGIKKFIFANQKEDNSAINKRNAQIETLKDKEYLVNKVKETELRNDRILKGQTVYKKGIYEIPETNFL